MYFLYYVNLSTWTNTSQAIWKKVLNLIPIQVYRFSEASQISPIIKKNTHKSTFKDCLSVLMYFLHLLYMLSYAEMKKK